MKVFTNKQSTEWDQDFLCSERFRNFTQAVREAFVGFDGDIRHLAYALHTEIDATVCEVSMDMRYKQDDPSRN